MARVAPWLIALLAFGLAVAALVYAQSRDAAASEADRAKEAAQLVAEDYVVAARVEADVARADAAALFAKASALEAKVATMEKRGAHVETVIRVATDPLTVLAPPSDQSGSSDSPPCLVAPGDQMQLRVNAVSLETVAQNLVLVAEAEAWRLGPTPDQDLLLVRGELRGRYEVVPPPVDTRWPWWAHELIGVGAGLVAGRLLR